MGLHGPMTQASKLSRKLRLDTATRDLDPPFAVIDVEAFEANQRDLARRSAGTPIRVASKSLRCRWALQQALADPAFAGVLAFTLPEAIWLATETETWKSINDVVVGYPTTNRHALATLAASSQLRSRVTVMIDDVEQVKLIEAAVAKAGDPSAVIRVCIDVDSSWRPHPIRQAPPAHIGARRSPLHDSPAVLRLVDAVLDSPACTAVGMMFYEAQIAGLGDNPPGHPLRARAIAALQAASRKELRQRRPQIVAAVTERLSQAGAPALEFVNAGGTGSLEYSAADPSVTEVTAGSGFFAPTLFDAYRHFHPEPAAMFALPVVRRPGPGTVTALGGGYIASGIADPSRLPTPWLPSGLKLDSQEGAGEVQTPLRGKAADGLAIGDRVWFRHAKAGELAERFNEFVLVRGKELVGTTPTYRGEGQAFL